jgi:hypothetical protein
VVARLNGSLTVIEKGAETLCSAPRYLRISVRLFVRVSWFGAWWDNVGNNFFAVEEINGSF